MKFRSLLMIIGRMLPLLLIFVLPLIGISGRVGIFIFVLVMFGRHLLAMRFHQGEHTEHHNDLGGRHGAN